MNGDFCDFYFDSAQKLKVLDVQLPGKHQLKPFGFCEISQMRETKFHYNTSWISTNSNLFTMYVRKRGNNGKSINVLSLNGSLNSFYNGLLIKLIFGCTYNGKTDDRCVVFKTRGTNYYVDITTGTSSSPITPTSLPTDVVLTAKKSTVDVPSLSTADAVSPTAVDSKDGNRNMWIVVALGLSALLLIVIVGIIGFLVLRCQRKCISQRTGQRHHQRACDRSPGSPLHDYEYIHYPCLTEGFSSPPHTPMGCPMYERGPNNKLIIWSEGHKPTNRESVEAAVPRLPYQRLLARASSTSGDCGMVVRPLSPASGDVFPYQKLVRTEAQVEGQQVGCSTEQCAVRDISTTDPEPGRENYRSLAYLEVLKCTPEDCERCTSKQEWPGPDKAEHDYARVAASLDNSRFRDVLVDSSSNSNRTPRTSEENGCAGDFCFAVVNAAEQSLTAGVVNENGWKPSSEFEDAGADEDRNAEFSKPTYLSLQEGESLEKNAETHEDAGSQRSSVIDGDTSHEYMELEALKTAEDQTVDAEHEEI